MNLSSTDRCPHCGSPYMSSLKPGQRPEDRYCYTCSVAAGDSKKQINLQAARPASGDDLELQPIEDEAPTAAPNVPPSGRVSRSSGVSSRANIPAASGSRANIRAASSGSRASIAAASGSRVGIRAASGSRSDLRAARPDIPQLAPTPADYARSEFPLKAVLGACAALALAAVLYFALRGKTNPESASTDQQTSQAAPGTDTTSAPKTALNSVASSKPASTDASKASTTQDLTKKPPAPVQNSVVQATDAVIKSRAEPKNTSPDFDDIVAKGARKKNTDDDDAGAAKTPAPLTKPPTTGEVAKTDSTEKPPEAPVELDADGKPKPRKALVDVIGGIGEKSVKPDVETKKENPFAAKVIAVTATEPTIMPFEIDRIGGNDKTMTEQLAPILPGWHVRDTNKDNSKMGLRYPPTPLGRENAIVLNPMNDVLPAKLIATVEIPKKFAAARPTLVFEVANPSNNKEWLVSVKVMNTDILPKTRVKTTKDEPWTTLFVDLTPMADRHFDLEICAFAPAKKVTKEMLSYIRNVRIEWIGKKK